MSDKPKNYLFAGASSAIAIATAAQLKQKGHKVIGLSTKTTDSNYDQLLSLDKYDFNSFPSMDDAIDGLVYFPGTINLKPFARLTKADFMNDFEVNALGAVACIQAYLNNLKKADKPSIVLISSVAVSTGMPFHSSIALAKGALEGLTRALAAEFAPSIRVNCVAPSLVSTPLAERFINTPEKIEVMKKKNPLHKIGESSDIGNAISFLLSDDSAWVSGQVLAVDGGMSSLKNS